MKKILAVVAVMALSAGTASAQTQRLNLDEIVELELLTSSEVAAKIKAGMTSVLVVAGGTEIRGPHAVLGVHTILANRRAVGAAKRLGNALVAPVLPVVPSATGGRPENPETKTSTSPGAIQIPAEAFRAVVQGEVESMVWNGFTDIFLMGDHGGGQDEMKAVAAEMDQKLSPQGIHVYYINDFYQKTHDDIDMYMYEHELPIAGHGGMMETAEMMYWEPYQYAYVRENYKTAPLPAVVPNADPEEWKRNRDARLAGVRPPGGGRRGGGRPAAASDAPAVELYGLRANPHPATKEIGKDLAEIGISNTVAEIKAQLAEKRGAGPR